MYDTSFGQNNHIKVHRETVHEGKKPFKCKICNATFSQKGHLKSHNTSIHERKKSFKCNLCDGCFSQKGSLKVHVDSIHEGKKSFKCTNAWKAIMHQFMKKKAVECTLKTRSVLKLNCTFNANTRFIFSISGTSLNRKRISTENTLSSEPKRHKN